MASDTLRSVISTQCPACGSLKSPSGRCEPCGSPLVVTPRIERSTASEVLRGSLLLPFLRSEQARAAVSPEALRPVLLPAWMVDVDVRSTWAAGPDRRGTRTVNCRGLVIPAGSEASGVVLAAALQGSGAEPVSIPLGELCDWTPLPVCRDRAQAWASACEHLAATATEEAAFGLGLDETEKLKVDTRFEHGRVRPLLVPAWRAEGRGFTVHVEAHGGRMVGGVPCSPRRLVALLAGVAGLLAAAVVAFA